jgi:hypothetical protein
MTEQSKTASGQLAAGQQETIETSNGKIHYNTINGHNASNGRRDLVSLELIQQLCKQAEVPPEPEPEVAETESVFKPLGLSELLKMPPKQWVIDQVIGPGDLMMIYGPPGSGKTFVVIDLIFSACLGRRWAGRFNTARPLTVAYCAGEGLGGLPARFKAAAEHYGVDELPNFYFFKEVPQLYKADSRENVEQFMIEWKQRQEAGHATQLDLLIIDTLHSSTVGADENSTKDMGLVLDAARFAMRALGCSVVLVHHTNKTGASERGSSSLRCRMDSMITVKQFGTKWAIDCEKLKDGEEWHYQPFSLSAKAESVRVWWHEPVEPGQGNSKQEQDKERIVQVLATAGEPLTDKTIHEMLGIGRSQVNKLLAQLVEDGEIEQGIRAADKPKSNWNPWVYSISVVSEVDD